MAGGIAGSGMAGNPKVFVLFHHKSVLEGAVLLWRERIRDAGLAVIDPFSSDY